MMSDNRKLAAKISKRAGMTNNQSYGQICSSQLLFCFFFDDLFDLIYGSNILIQPFSACSEHLLDLSAFAKNSISWICRFLSRNAIKRLIASPQNNEPRFFKFCP